MCQKSIINNPKTAVNEMLDGISCAYPGLYVNSDKGYVLLDKDRNNKVALVCGSGAGYEPFATGFVGEGMLTGYISGKVGQPPRSSVILSVISTLAELNKGGVVVLILNYPREVLNFGLAIERARSLGLRVESAVLVDECSRWKAMRNEHYTNLAYKKGLCGCVFSIKILGALSSAGAPITHLVNEARSLNFRTTTLGFCLEPFCYPGSHKPAFTIPRNSAVIGLGLNGENGIKVVKITSAKDIVRRVLPKVYEESNLNRNSTVFILINCLCSLTGIESYIIAKEVHKYLTKRRVVILRVMVGRFFTSFDAKGAHISIVNLTDKGTDWVSLFDMETEAYGWPNMKLSVLNTKWQFVHFCNEAGPPPKSREGLKLDENEKEVFAHCIQEVCYSLIDAEIVLNQLNAYDGNGDCGTKLRDFSKFVLQKLRSLPTKDVSLTLEILERYAEEKMSGKIGSVYAALLFGASRHATSWPKCFKGAVRFLGAHFPIVSGFRTLFDVIKPASMDFVEYWNFLGPNLWRTTLLLAVDTAEKKCYATSQMIPKVGVYHPEQKMNMDAGAYSVVVWLRAINDTLKELLPPPSFAPTNDWRYRLEDFLLSQKSQRMSQLHNRFQISTSEMEEESEEENQVE